jgi:hypothetical protein
MHLFSFSSDPISSPTPSHHAAPIYMNATTRNKVPHDVFVYPILTSTPAQQQPIHARQRFVFNYFSNLEN